MVRELYGLVNPLLNDSEMAYLILDDSVQDKHYSTKIELNQRQYSGAVHGLVQGIWLVNLVYSDGTITTRLIFVFMLKTPMAIIKTTLFETCF